MEYCQSKGITYVDLEKAIDFDIGTGLPPPLNKYGAVKATDYQAPIILQHIQ